MQVMVRNDSSILTHLFWGSHYVFVAIIAVVMAATKYLTRIKAPIEFEECERKSSRSSNMSALHDHTYGISSDPLTHFGKQARSDFIVLPFTSGLPTPPFLQRSFSLP